MAGPLWIERLTLDNFRNYHNAALEADPGPVVLVGANGAGKTNVLEAVSLLAPGQGLRRAPLADIARRGADGGWAVAARLHTAGGVVDVGTGLPASGLSNAGPERAGRIVRIDGGTQPASALATYTAIVWLTPAMDGLFAGPASERRRFLDRLIAGFDSGYRAGLGQFERAMQQRNRLLADGVRDGAQFEGLEIVMAEAGVAVAAARAAAAAQLAGTIGERRARDPESPFPWAAVAIEGTLERGLGERPAVDVEDSYRKALRDGRERDRAAGRALDGPHRSDLVVGHGPKAMPAALGSTGEQKALLIGLVLAQAELMTRRRNGGAPILLLDEIAAHLDSERRETLFREILRLGTQAWMTGTDERAFAVLTGRGGFHRIENGRIMRTS